MEIVVIVLVVVLLAAGGWYFYTRREVTDTGAAGTAVAAGLRGRLTKSRTALAQALDGVFRRPAIDDGFWQEMEEALIAADVGVGAAVGVVERVRTDRPADTEAARAKLAEELVAVLTAGDRSLDLQGDPAVVLVMGVNGTGKTTSIAKLAGRLVAEGRQPLLAAADTFRAAADAQLRTWADRVGVPVVGGKEGSDPAAVAFDGLSAAKARGKDVLVVDTAGRLHSKGHLMAELAKIRRVLEREGGRVSESLLVLDATQGQNGIAQVREFAQSVGLTGIILTKLDSTARGGIVVAVEQELGVPVKLVGVGEGIDDLVPFQPDEFVAELLGEE
ncbi:MAG TPA: signal recognition particle-docking protein FtsY [Acidimicrobiia bacterium]|nr:signal recognition particle-docking protein FtsY [Acidimicrobiia bacterium]